MQKLRMQDFHKFRTYRSGCELDLVIIKSVGSRVFNRVIDGTFLAHHNAMIEFRAPVVAKDNYDEITS